MPKSAGQKQKILTLMQILLRETDEQHPMTISDMITRLSAFGVNAERKTIYDDLETLRLFGLDIVALRSRGCVYYVGNRDFELPELKLLVNAVESSRFITEKKSRELINKLETLASKYDGAKLQRQVFIHNRVKTMNESIYYNVDAIHEAIAAEKKIRFQYFEYNIQKERVFRKDGKVYVVSPVALNWAEENYYLIARGDHEGLTHYRVDKMSGIEQTDEQSQADLKDFNLADYSKKVFGMFGGEEIAVKLRVNNNLIGVVIDRFGKEVMPIKEDEAHFTVTVNVAVSPVFIGWLFGFGSQMKVLAPQSLINELKGQVAELYTLYQ